MSEATDADGTTRPVTDTDGWFCGRCHLWHNPAYGATVCAGDTTGGGT